MPVTNPLQHIFLAGAPKCGTSSLFDFLAKHPAVAPSIPKETFYFLDQGHPLLNAKANVHTDGLAGFQSFFQEKGQFLEATTHLIYQREMIAPISSLRGVKMIFLLREPARRILSSYEYTSNNLANFKHPLPFSDYVDLLLENDTRKLDDYMFDNASKYVLSRDLSYSKYVEHIQRWSDAMDEKNILITTLENIQATPAEELSRIVSFLGLYSKEVKLELPKKNNTVGIKNKYLHKLAQLTGNRFKDSALKRGLKRIYYSAQAKQIDRSTSDHAALERLKAYFLPYNQQLEDRFTVDISRWK